MTDAVKLKQIVEGLLLAAGRPLSLEQIGAVFEEEERPENKALLDALECIAEQCAGRGFELSKVASGYRFQVRQELSPWIAGLWEERPQKYSRALLETLAIIAYRQPITRGDIEKIRGVAVSTSIIRTLLDREWIRVVGHRDVPGRPAMYASTRQFLDYFNLSSLEQLPALAEIRDLEDLNRELSLGDEKTESRVLDLPPEVEEQEPEHNGLGLPDEDAAAVLAARPLDEILRYGESDESEAASDAPEAPADSPEAAAGGKEDKDEDKDGAGNEREAGRHANPPESSR